MPAPDSITRWPALAELGLDANSVQRRRFCIGGSDANTILSGDPSRVLELWNVKRGIQSSPDLSSKLNVMLGNWTEPFHRLWHERETGHRVSELCSVFTCQSHSWRRATVDGLAHDRAAVWEAKHTSAFAKPDEVVARYMPQLQHNMAVVGVESSVLSVLYGNHRWEVFEVAADWLYQDALLAAERAF